MTTLLIIIVVLLLLILWIRSVEGFTSKREKADAIKTWFDKNDPPEYANYKTAIKNSDVIEYTQIKKMGGARDTSAIESLIS